MIVKIKEQVTKHEIAFISYEMTAPYPGVVKFKGYENYTLLGGNLTTVDKDGKTIGEIDGSWSIVSIEDEGAKS